MSLMGVHPVGVQQTEDEPQCALPKRWTQAVGISTTGLTTSPFSVSAAAWSISSSR